jgi:hypothetical protein
MIPGRENDTPPNLFVVAIGNSGALGRLFSLGVIASNLKGTPSLSSQIGNDSVRPAAGKVIVFVKSAEPAGESDDPQTATGKKDRPDLVFQKGLMLDLYGGLAGFEIRKTAPDSPRIVF